MDMWGIPQNAQHYSKKNRNLFLFNKYWNWSWLFHSSTLVQCLLQLLAFHSHSLNHSMHSVFLLHLLSLKNDVYLLVPSWRSYRHSPTPEIHLPPEDSEMLTTADSCSVHCWICSNLDIAVHWVWVCAKTTFIFILVAKSFLKRAQNVFGLFDKFFHLLEPCYRVI